FFQQAERSIQVGVDEVVRAVNRAVDVTLRREMDDRSRPMCDQQLGNEFTIANVALQKSISAIGRNIGEIRGVSGVGQLVEIDDSGSFRSKPLQDEIRSDETCPAGD